MERPLISATMTVSAGSGEIAQVVANCLTAEIAENAEQTLETKAGPLNVSAVGLGSSATTPFCILCSATSAISAVSSSNEGVRDAIESLLESAFETPVELHHWLHSLRQVGGRL